MLYKEIEFLSGEYWYGGAVNDGYLFPLSENDTYSIDLTYNDTYNQINPFFVSSKGRYIWLENAGIVSFQKGVIKITARDIEFEDALSDLPTAHTKAMQRHFPPTGGVPDEYLFSVPQICSWIHLQKNQTQQGILDYARNYVRNGYKPGLFIIDDSWQVDFGSWDFNKERFPNPKKMIDELHALGFKVALWLAPYVTPKTDVAELLKAKDALVKNDKGEILFASWFDGTSYMVDFSKPFAKAWIKGITDHLESEYGTDAYKLDCGDAQYLDREYKEGNERNLDWAKAINCDKTIIELRSCYKFGGRRCVQRLADKAHDWDVKYVKSEEVPSG